MTINLRDLTRKALEYQKSGLTEREIADELHLSRDSVRYLLEEGYEGTLPPTDVKVGWRSVGVYGNRMELMCEIMADIIAEELERADQVMDSVMGIAMNGISFATLISHILGSELVVYLPPEEKGKVRGAFSTNYASVKGKKVVIVDDVLSTGGTAYQAVQDVRDEGGEPVLLTVMINKSSLNEVDEVPLRGVIRARSMGGTILGLGPLHSFPYR
jgi:orotate phosphoribosyltransferase